MDIWNLITKDLDKLALKCLNFFDFKIDRKQSFFNQYLKLKHWMLKDRPRKVSFSNVFSIPSTDIQGLEILVSKITEGNGNIFQYQSRGLFKGSAKDLMLYDFGIHHLHLGIDEDPIHKKMIQGTKHVAFAYINEEEVFFIRIAQHGEWHLQDTLKIIQKERADLIEHRICSNMIGEILSDQEVLNLRENHMNYFLDVNGYCYRPASFICTPSLPIQIYLLSNEIKRKIELILKNTYFPLDITNLIEKIKSYFEIIEFDFYENEYFVIELRNNNVSKNIKYF